MGTKSASKPTPVRHQYLQIKQSYPDAILFFRLGDFYETFDEDAKITARELDLVLTSRPVGKGQRVPLAGIPYHAVEGYVARLIDKGYKVAICEQIGNQTVKGLVPREVVRVVTPGTVLEPTLLDDRRNNYLAAFVHEQERAGLAFADISTGEFATTEMNGPEASLTLAQELQRLQPAEILIPEGSGPDTIPPSVNTRQPVTLEDWRFGSEAAQRTLQEHFGVASLDGFGLRGKPLATRAAGALLQYLQQTQKRTLPQLQELSTYSTAQFMLLDSATRRNLELTAGSRSGTTTGSLLGVLDLTRSAMGARLLRRRIAQPLLDCKALEARLDGVQTFFDNTALRTEVRTLLKGLPDLERLANRLVAGMARPRDLVGIRQALETTAALLQTTKEAGHPTGLDPCHDVRNLISQAISDDPPATLNATGIIRRAFSAELDGIVAAARDAKQWVANLEVTERKRTGIKNLKVGYNQVFGYYLEVTKANTARVPAEYIRKQTLVNAERYITPELKEYESLILNAEARQQELEGQIFRQICEQVSAAAPRLLSTARTLATLDVHSALAEVALRNRYVRPVITEEDRIIIRGGRHPVVETTLQDEPFAPNDTNLSADESIHIITGPNMSGKSTFLRQVALITLMAQIGSFVPADSAEIGLVDRIFSRVGAQDEISAGQSTFMVEMVETANILHHATPRSLIILDEIGRGTSTYDGMSIAWAVVEYVHNHPDRRAKTLFATHYHELTELEKILPHVRNYNVAVAEEGDQVVFLHRIVPGGADRSYGIHVARLAGIPRTVTQRAQEILTALEQDSRMPTQSTHKQRPEAVRQAIQLALFPSEPHPVVQRLIELDVDSLTPLEAINILYDLKKQSKGPTGNVAGGNGGDTQPELQTCR